MIVAEFIETHIHKGDSFQIQKGKTSSVIYTVSDEPVTLEGVSLKTLLKWVKWAKYYPDEFYKSYWLIKI